MLVIKGGSGGEAKAVGVVEMEAVVCGRGEGGRLKRRREAARLRAKPGKMSAAQQARGSSNGRAKAHKQKERRGKMGPQLPDLLRGQTQGFYIQNRDTAQVILRLVS